MRLVLAVSFMTVILSGCQTPAEIKAQKKAGTDYEVDLELHCMDLEDIGKAQAAKNIRNKRFSIGMTKLDVIYALRLVGSESSGLYSSKPGAFRYGSEQVVVNKTVTRYGTRTQWVMPDRYTNPTYLYFDDGILESWQGN